jgi:hypothetical protein
MTAFIAWVSKGSASDHGLIPSTTKIDFEIGIWWLSNKIAALRETSYNKTINYSLRSQ